MQKRETLFKNRVLKDLKSLPNIWILKTQEVGRRGTPDLLICLGGEFIAIELKKDESSKITPLQEAVLGMISRAGGRAFSSCPERWDAQFELLESQYLAKRERALLSADAAGLA